MCDEALITERECCDWGEDSGKFASVAANIEIAAVLSATASWSEVIAGERGLATAAAAAAADGDDTTILFVCSEAS